MALPGETEAGSAGKQPCRGIARRAHRDDDHGRGSPLSRSSPNPIGSIDPDALKIPARRAASTLTPSARSPVPAEPAQDSLRQGATQAAGAAPTLRYSPAGDSAPPLRLKAAGMTERFPFGPSTRPEPPLFPREQRISPDRPAAVQGAKRRSEPLTARTDLERFAVRERRSEPTELLSQYTWAQLLILELCHS